MANLSTRRSPRRQCGEDGVALRCIREAPLSQAPFLPTGSNSSVSGHGGLCWPLHHQRVCPGGVLVSPGARELWLAPSSADHDWSSSLPLGWSLSEALSGALSLWLTFGTSSRSQDCFLHLQALPRVLLKPRQTSAVSEDSCWVRVFTGSADINRSSIGLKLHSVIWAWDGGGAHSTSESLPSSLQLPSCPF